MTMQQFRSARVTVVNPNGWRIVFDTVRIEFEIRSNADEDTAPSYVRVYNLADATASELAAGDNITVEAGYGLPDQLLYSGKVRSVFHERDRLNRITEIFLGGIIETESVEVFSHSGPADNRETVLAIADAMGTTVDLGTLSLVPLGQRDSWSINARPRDAMSIFLKPLNLKWHEENGQIRLAPTTGTLAVRNAVISEGSTMIGSPSYVDEGKTGIRCRVVMTSQMRVGDTVHIESLLATGDFVVSTISQVGDNWQGDWYTEFEASEAVE